MKKKITFVVFLLAVMLIAICVSLYRLYMPGFYIVTAILAVYGFCSAARDFRHWMIKDAPESAELPPVGFGAHEQKAEQAEERPRKKKSPTITVENPATREETTIIEADFSEIPDYTRNWRYAQ